jgi:hypothetical protein
MISLEMESPGMAGTKTGAGTMAGTPRSSTARTALQAAWRRGSSLLIILAAWLIRTEHRRLARNIPAGWDAALSLQLDRLTDIRERLAEYLDSERRQP